MAFEKSGHRESQVILDSWHEQDVQEWVRKTVDVEKRNGENLGHFVVHGDREDGRDDRRKPAQQTRDNDSGCDGE